MVAAIVPLRGVGKASPPLALPQLSLSDRLAILAMSVPLSGTLSLLPLRATTMAPATLLGAAARWAVVAYVLRLLRRQQKQEGRLKTASAAGVEGSRFAADPSAVLLTSPKSEEGACDTDIQTLGKQSEHAHAELTGAGALATTKERAMEGARRAF